VFSAHLTKLEWIFGFHNVTLEAVSGSILSTTHCSEDCQCGRL